MQITKIEKQKRQRYRIYLNDEPAFCLYRNDLDEYSLAEGDELSDDIYGVICHEVLLRRAKLSVLELLQRSDRTAYQLRRSLRRSEYPETVIDEAIAYAASFHYVDDARYAQHYVEQHEGSKSRMEMASALRGRGISAEDIDAAFAQAGEQDVREVIMRWMRKKHFDPSAADQKETEKFILSLMRRGLPYGQVRRVLDELEGEFDIDIPSRSV